MTTPENATNVVSYQWYADGEAINLATTSSLKVTSDLKGKKIKVVITDDAGKTFESAESAAVSEDNTATVEIVDASGLQTDGTGLVGDTLRLTYGSALGNPASITWYYNDKVVQAYTNQTGNLTDALALETKSEKLKPVCKEGVYRAVIVNTEGTSFESTNTITLVNDQLKAEVNAFAIVDDLTDPANVDYRATDAGAVFTVTVNKGYEGTFYIYKDETVNYTNTNMVTSLAFDPEATSETASAGKWTVVTSASKMTANNVFKNAVDSTGAATNSNGLMFVDEDGKTSIMWITADALTRGTKYKVAFDQEGVADDNLSGTARKDIVVSDSVEMAYLPAPEKIALTTVTKDVQAKAELLDAEGNVMTAFGDGDDLAGFESIKVFGGDSATTSTDKKAESGTIKKGIWTSEGNLKDAKYYYAVAKTTAGVFAADSATLTSDYKAQNVAIAAELKWSEDADTPANAKIALKGVVGPATVYIYNPADWATGVTFDPTDSSTYRNSVAITAGLGEASIPNVFKKTDIGGIFIAVIVPDDEATYSRLYDVNDSDVLMATAASVEYDEDATLKTTVTAAKLVTFNNLKIMDQFGQALDTDNFKAVEATTAEVKAVDKGGTCTESATAKYQIDSDGLITVQFVSTSGVDIDDGYDLTLLGSTINMRATANSAAGADWSATGWTIKLASDELMTGVVGNTTVYTASQLKSALAAAAKETTANTITLGDNIISSDDITIDAKDTLNMNGKNLTYSGTMTVDGTLTMGAGTLTSTGIINVGDGATFTVSTGGTLANNGVIDLDAGATFTDSGTVAGTGYYNVRTADQFGATVADTATERTVVVAKSLVSDDANYNANVEVLEDVVLTIGANSSVAKVLTVDEKTTGTAAGKIVFETSTAARTLTIAATGELVNNGVVEVTTHAANAGKIANNGKITDNGTFTIGAAAEVTNSKTAVFAGGSATTIPDGKLIVDNGSATTFTNAMTGATTIHTKAGLNNNDTFTITVGSATGNFKVDGTTAATLATATELSTATSAAPQLIKADKSIILGAGATTYTTNVD